MIIQVAVAILIAYAAILVARKIGDWFNGY